MASRSGASRGSLDGIERMALDAALHRVPSQARSRLKVERALRAAQEMVELEGVDAVTLPRVAKAAGISVGALYQYMPDRDAVVAALTAVYHARHEALMDELIAHGPDPEADDSVSSVLRAVAAIYREQSGTRALRSALHAAAHAQLVRGHKERMVAKVHALLVAHGLVDADAPDLVARMVFFAADGAMHEVFADSTEGDPALLTELESMLSAYLTARSAP